ncbi:unnamed protein product [Ambrosiozyma monospora]|uniref:Unnamed protein product n=1 Tax=Ambrosiozyma monospora TaxID=43982 RepID=A0ACB5U7R8_AMBMO|nr:unnamed protein product [Ambrosiozyma monospora]
MAKNHQANEIFNALTHLKFFAKYFFKPDPAPEAEANAQANAQETDALCKTASQSLFTWLSGYYPTFTKYNRRLEPSVVRHFDPNESCMITNLQSSLTGRGIVITASDGQVAELAGLLATLRLLNTQIPIQIVHNDDLSLLSIKSLVEIALNPVFRLPKSQSNFKAPTKIPHTLDLTFVDVSKTISFRYKDYFQRWGMKLLAYLFNSFEEMILLDTDTRQRS